MYEFSQWVFSADCLDAVIRTGCRDVHFLCWSSYFPLPIQHKIQTSARKTRSPKAQLHRKKSPTCHALLTSKSNSSQFIVTPTEKTLTNHTIIYLRLTLRSTSVFGLTGISLTLTQHCYECRTDNLTWRNLSIRWFIRVAADRARNYPIWLHFPR